MDFFDILLAKKLEDDRDPKVEGLSVTANGTYSEDGVVYKPVVVNVPETPLSSLAVTANGTYTAPTGTGYNEVSVNVPAPANALFIKNYEGVPTSIASFNDGTSNPLKSLTASIVPVQDLHGYDSPWVGGAGKNKINLADITTPSAGFVYNRAPINVVVNTYTLSFNYTGNSGSISISLRNGETVVSTLQDQPLVNGLNMYTLPTLSNNADSISLYAGIGGTYENFMLEVGSTATSFAPYSNICPISGWTEEVVSVSGVNLLDYDKWKNSSVTRGTAIWEDNGVTITATSNDAYVSPTNSKTFVKEGQTIILKWEESTNKSGTIYLFPNGSTEGMATVNNQTVKNLTYTVPSGVTFITFRFGVNNSGETIAYKNIRLEFGNQSPTFVPYNGQTYTIPFTDGQGQSVEVFGGSVDVVNGGEQQRTFGVVDLGTLNYSYYSGNLFTVRISDLKPVPNEVLCDALCSIYVAKKGNEYSSIDGSFVAGFNNSPVLAIHDSRFTDATAFKQAMNGVQLVYELATPTTFNTQPTSIKSLDGENNVFASTGDVEELKYFTRATS